MFSPLGHHCGRNGCTKGSLSTGFCLLNNAAIALTYARIYWGIQRIAIVDIDVHYGNGTAEIVKNDSDTFFASIHMIFGPKNDGNYQNIVKNKDCGCGFFPANQGITEVTDNYVSVGVYPADIYAMECAPASSSSSSSFTGSDMSVMKEEKTVNDDDNLSLKSEKTANDDEEEKDKMSVDNEGIETTEKATTSSSSSTSSSHPVCYGANGYLYGLEHIVIPKLKEFQPDLLIISGNKWLFFFCFMFLCLLSFCVFLLLLLFLAGFDGCSSDPIGGEMNLSTKDYAQCTKMVRISTFSLVLV
jgi:hypothetical protein